MTEVCNLHQLRGCLARLDDTDLEALCLDEFPSVHDEFSPGMLRTEKINLLLAHCRRDREACMQLATWCQKRFPPPTPTVNFVNRIAELNLVQQSFNVYTWVIDAPAGYGKTWFLQELKRRYEGQGWRCFYLALQPPPETLSELAAALLAVLHISPPIGISEINKWGEYLANGIEVQLAAQAANVRPPEHSGVAILLDDVHQLPEMLFADLARLLGSARTCLKDSDFTRRCNELRFFMAGRGAAQKSYAVRSILPLTPLPLSPYTLTIIQESIGQYVRRAQVLMDSNQTAALAAHLMSHYGGHPQCCAAVLDELLSWHFGTGALKALWRQTHTQTLPYIAAVLNDLTACIPEMESLRPALETLSVFRRFDNPLLDALQQHHPPLLTWKGSNLSLINALQATFLLSRQDTFLQDNLTRRLFTIYLRCQNPEHFQALCTFGVEYYERWLRSLKSRRIEYVAAEYIYQWAQYAHFVLCQPPDTFRQSLLAALATAGEILQAAWSSDALRDLWQVLAEDWELEFMVNAAASAPGTYQNNFYRTILDEQAQLWGL